MNILWMWSLYRWYDRLREPYKFLLMLVVAGIGIVAVALGDSLIRLLGAIYLVFLLWSRLNFIEYGNKS